MRSVSREARLLTVAAVLRLPVEERIALALSLGDEDVRRFAASSGLSEAEARRRMAAARADGRRPSRAAASR